MMTLGDALRILNGWGARDYHGVSCRQFCLSLSSFFNACLRTLAHGSLAVQKQGYVTTHCIFIAEAAEVERELCRRTDSECEANREAAGRASNRRGTYIEKLHAE